MARLRRLWSRPRRPSRHRLKFEPLEARRVLALFIVNDPGPNQTDPEDAVVTLADAIQSANDTPGVDFIQFAESVTQVGQDPQGNPLPFSATIRDPVIIDGDDRVVISGGFLNQAQLTVRDHTGTLITGLTFRRQPGQASVLITGGGQHDVIGNRFEPLSGGFGTRIGVEIRNSSNNTIGGPLGGDPNVFVGLGIGVKISSDASGEAAHNRIDGNLIGLDTDGTIRGNTEGIQIGRAAETEIEDNTIAGNGTGIVLQDLSSATVVTGNRIGVQVTADVAAGNGLGILANGVGDTIDNNLISGNVFGAGIRITGRDNVVRNNRVGTNDLGTAALPNSEGIVLRDAATGNVIGPDNLVSGNQGNGIVVETLAATPTRNRIVGNTIGLNLERTAKLSNQGNGIAILHATETRIGGPSVGDGNFISGNRDHGIFLTGGPFAGNNNDTTLTFIERNKIGIGRDGIGLGNGKDGIHVGPNVDFTRIGAFEVMPGDAATSGNLIDSNEGHGVRIVENRQTDGSLEDPGNHAIIGNRIGGNGKQDIDTGPLGPNVVDEPDVDGFLNSPEHIDVREGSTVIRFRLPVAPGRYVIETYDETTGELLQRDSVTVGSDNTFEQTIAGPFRPHVRSTITKVDENGDPVTTSEYSVTVVPPVDLLIKGTYERDEHFRGDDQFAPAVLQESMIFSPIAPQIQYQHTVALQSQSDAAQTIEIAAAELAEQRDAWTVEYSLDGEDVTSSLANGNRLAVALEANATRRLQVDIRGDFRNDPPDIEPNDAIFATISAFLPGSSVAVDRVTASATNALIVNSSSDKVGDLVTLAAHGIVDVSPEIAGQQTSLRGAIALANSLPETQEIQFAVAGDALLIHVGASGLGTLPKITDGLKIRANHNVEIRGRRLGDANEHGLVIASGPARTDVEGLLINNFSGSGILVENGRAGIADNHIGTIDDESAGVERDGIEILGGEIVFVVDNVIGKARTGIRADSVFDLILSRNRIGVSPTNEDIGAGTGIRLTNPSKFLINANTIGFNQGDGIVVESANANAGNSDERRVLTNEVGIVGDDIPAGNQGAGIRIHGVSNVRVSGNKVARNRLDGISIGAEARDVLVEGNQVGTSLDGMASAANLGFGIRVVDANATIGGTAEIPGTGSGNRIGPNGMGAVFIREAGPGNPEDDLPTTRVQGNLIGIAADGMTRLEPASPVGIRVSFSRNVLIGAELADDAPLRLEHHPQGNVIAGFSRSAIEVVDTSRGIIVNGNTVGANADQNRVLGNGRDGIVVEDSDVAQVSGNLIVGSGEHGLRIHRPLLVEDAPAPLRIRANRIGGGLASPIGNEETGSGLHGIRILGAPSPVAIEDNLIGRSGVLTVTAPELVAEAIAGVAILDSRSVSLVDNAIGGDPLGLVQGNFEAGVLIDNSTDITLLRNVVSGNGMNEQRITASSVAIRLAKSRNVAVRENILGFIPDADVGLPNFRGLAIEESQQVDVVRNTFFQNGNTELNVLEPSDDGEPTADLRIRNNQFVTNDVAIRIGGGDRERIVIDENRIERRGEPDVVTGPSSILIAGNEGQITVRKNTIVGSTISVIDDATRNTLIVDNDFRLDGDGSDLLIELVRLLGGQRGDPVSFGQNDNDALDADGGPNGFQNFPRITAAREVAGPLPPPVPGFQPERRIGVEGRLESLPNSRFRIDFYPTNANRTRIANTAQNGFKRNVLIVETDAGGGADFQAVLTGFPFDASATHITATATLLADLNNPAEPLQSTSEMSPAVAIGVAADTDGDGIFDQAEQALGSGDADRNGIADDGEGNVFAITQVGRADNALPPGLDLQVVFETARRSFFENAKTGIVQDPQVDVGDGRPIPLPQVMRFVEVNIRDVEAGGLATVQLTFSEPVNEVFKLDTEGRLHPLTADEAAHPGIRVEFAPNHKTATVFIRDNGPFDANPLEGEVRDPISVLLNEALRFDAAEAAVPELTLRRDGDALELLADATNEVLENRALADTLIAVLLGADNADDRLTLDFAGAGDNGNGDGEDNGDGDGEDDSLDLRDPIVFDARGGNDELRIASGNLGDGCRVDVAFDGGEGRDVLRLTGETQLIDLTQLPAGTVSNVEEIDVTGSGANRLVIDFDSVAGVSSDGVPLRIRHDADDSVEYGPGWIAVGPRIADGEFLQVVTQEGISIEVANPRAFQNPLQPLDTNLDGVISPQDVLRVINDLNRDGPRLLVPPVEIDPNALFTYLDANGDGTVNSFDALVTINFLNRRAESGGA